MRIYQEIIDGIFGRLFYLSIIDWQVKKDYSASPAWVSTRRVLVEVLVAFSGDERLISPTLLTRSSGDVLSFARLVITVNFIETLNIQNSEYQRRYHKLNE